MVLGSNIASHIPLPKSYAQRFWGPLVRVHQPSAAKPGYRCSLFPCWHAEPILLNSSLDIKNCSERHMPAAGAARRGVAKRICHLVEIPKEVLGWIGQAVGSNFARKALDREPEIGAGRSTRDVRLSGILMACDCHQLAPSAQVSPRSVTHRWSSQVTPDFVGSQQIPTNNGKHDWV